MKYSYKFSCTFLFLASFWLLSPEQSQAAKVNKGEVCNVKKMDRSAEIVFVLGRRDVYLPKNQKEMGPHCQEEFDAEDYIRKYARNCLKPFPRQLIGVILLGASQVIRTRCKPDGTKEYLSHYACIKTAIPKLHDCMDQLVVALTEIKTKPNDQRIPFACCSFSRYISCSAKPVRKYCSNDATAEDYIVNKMIKGYASEVLDLACQGYDFNGDRCNKLILPDGGFHEGDNELILYRNATSRTKSLIPPFVEIFTQT